MVSRASVVVQASSNVIWVHLNGIQDEITLSQYLRKVDKFVQQQSGRWGRIVDLREWELNTPEIDSDIVSSLNRDLQRGLVCEVVIQPSSSVARWQTHKLVNATLQPDYFHEAETFEDALEILASKNLDTAF